MGPLKMSQIAADLHMHSTYSDGTFSPPELIEQAKQMNLSAISITDHDSVNAYYEAKVRAQDLGIDLITGVELSSELDGCAVHVLGYAFPPNHALIQEKCVWHQERRRLRNRQILEKLKGQNIIIKEEELVGIGAIGRPHIACVMMQKGYVRSIQEAFHRFIGENKICYVAGDRWSVLEAIDIIHQAQGLAVLAHPHVIKRKSLVKKLLQLPFDGLEANYANFDKGTNAYWKKIGEERGLLTTGGSDFHGTIKPDILLGASLCPEPDFCAIRDHFNAHL